MIVYITEHHISIGDLGYPIDGNPLASAINHSYWSYVHQLSHFVSGATLYKVGYLDIPLGNMFCVRGWITPPVTWAVWNKPLLVDDYIVVKWDCIYERMSILVNINDECWLSDDSGFYYPIMLGIVSKANRGIPNSSNQDSMEWENDFEHCSHGNIHE